MGVLKNRDLQVRITVLPGAIKTWDRTVLILPIQLCPCVWVGLNAQIQCDCVTVLSSATGGSILFQDGGSVSLGPSLQPSSCTEAVRFYCLW